MYCVWVLARWSKSTMGDCNFQSLAEDMGVHREVESGGSVRQISDPRNTNIIRHIRYG